MIVKLLTEHYLEFLSFKGGCRGLSESTLVKMPHCWKSHAVAQFFHMHTYSYILFTLNLIYKLSNCNRSFQSVIGKQYLWNKSKCCRNLLKIIFSGDSIFFSVPFFFKLYPVSVKSR